MFLGMKPRTPSLLMMLAMNHADMSSHPSNQSLFRASSEIDRKYWFVSGFLARRSEARVQSWRVMVR